MTISPATKTTAEFVALSTIAAGGAAAAGVNLPWYLWGILAVFYAGLVALVVDDQRHPQR